MCVQAVQTTKELNSLKISMKEELEKCTGEQRLQHGGDEDQKKT